MRFSVSAALFASVVASSAPAQLYEWVSPVDGDWHDAANWSLGFVPGNAASDVLLGFGSMYTVTASANTLVGEIDIANPNARLVIDGAEFDLAGDLSNEGTMRLESGTLDIILDRRFDGSGRVELGAVSDPMFAVIDALGATLTNGTGHTIAGSGRIQGFFHNDGIVVADDLGGPGLELDNFITQGVSGRIGANGGELLLQNDVSITGGELFTANGGVIRVEGPYNLNGIEATIDNVQISGRIDVLDSYNRLLVDGSIQNNGEIVINSELDADEPELRITSDASILGNGEIVLHSDSSSAAYMTADSGVTGTIGSNMTVRGTGIVNGVGGFVNNGAIIADDPDYLLVLLGDFSGSGFFGATSGSGLGLGEFADMVDCHFNTLGDGYIAVYYTIVDLFGGTNDGQFIVSGDGQLRISETFTNNGSIITDPGSSLNEDIQFLGDATILGDGEFIVDYAFGGFDGSSTSTVTFGPDQRIEGRASFDGMYVVEGVLAPEGDFDILDEMTLAPTARVSVVVGHDSVNDDGELDVEPGAVLNLAGELRVQFAETYTPAAGDSFRVVSGIPGTEILGSFDTTMLPAPPPGLVYEINEESFGLYLDIVEDTSVCPADLTGDGVLDFFDVSAFLGAYSAMDPAADFDGNGVFDFFDVSAFLGAFSVGCP